MAASNKASATFSEADTQLLMSMIRNSKGVVDPDWKKIAAECGYTNFISARNRWGFIKKKIYPKDGEESGTKDNEELPRTPTAKGKKRKVAETESTSFTPINGRKKVQKAGKGTTIAKSEEDEEDNNEDKTPKEEEEPSENEDVA